MKTIEEVEKEIYGKDDRQFFSEEYKSFFRQGVEFAQQWIPVEEELPETDEFEESKICLIKNKHAIDIGRYYSNKKRWFLSSSNFVVTHWRYVERQ